MISDLLASITGEKPSPSPAAATRPTLAVPKRKAEDELRSATTKTARIESVTNGSSRPNGASSSKPSLRPADRPLNTSSDKPVSTVRPPAPRAQPAPSRLEATTAKTSSVASTANRSKPLPTRPLVNRPVATVATSSAHPPKKRSFAEIMARAASHQEERQVFGKIQHKPVEKGLSMRERKEMKAEEAKKSRQLARQQGTGRGVAAAAPARGSINGKTQRSVTPSAPSSSKGKAGQPVTEEKKVKKAALATTGYTGTARPRPGASTTKPGVTNRPSAEPKLREKPRHGGGYGGSYSSRRDDDYDEELDDFIDYDDEEEEAGYGRQVDYESESDMEAGLTDLETEERRAELEARREDREQEALERRLKEEKLKKKMRMQGR